MSFFVYSENYIPGVGAPLLIVAMGRRDRISQSVETYLFISGKASVFLPEIRDWTFTDKFDAALLTEEQFVLEAVFGVEAQLESFIVREHADQYHAFLFKRSGFQVKDDAKFEIANLRARQGFRSELMRIAEITQNEELAELIVTRCRSGFTVKTVPLD